ncbi:UNVERIFIED_ORG: DNA segregation ATPase FtsK/SpoIIIE-like protein [Arthrobacter globiformis]|nr:DNA segregation ATPase FtsK/SpoIIIE-like protein [Arthrobacter globiformis]
MGIIRKTLSIGLTGGLIGFRSRSEKVARDVKVTAKNAQYQTALLRRQNTLTEQQTELIAKNHEEGYKMAGRVKPTPVSAEPTDPVDIALFTKASDIVVRDQVVSRRVLREELGVSYATVEHLLTLLEQQGYVSDPDPNGERDVLWPRRGGTSSDPTS